MTQSWQHKGPWLLQQGVGFNTQRDLTLGSGGLSKLLFEAGIVSLLVCGFCRCSLGRFVSQPLTKSDLCI